MDFTPPNLRVNVSSGGFRLKRMRGSLLGPSQFGSPFTSNGVFPCYIFSLFGWWKYCCHD